MREFGILDRHSMTAQRLSIFACFIILLGTFDFVSGDGHMTVSPSLSFCHENHPIDLVYRFESKKIDIGRRPFKENFTVTSNNGEILKHGYANAFKIGKPYVELKVKVYKPGSYLGTITGSSSSATAVVKQMTGEEPVVVAKAGTSLSLQCSDDYPPETKRFWKIGDTFVDNERSEWIEADDGSLEIQKIELNDGSKEMGCLYFNGTGLKEVYQQNKSALLPYQTAFTATPLIVFKATKTGIAEDRVKYTIQTASIKAGLTVEICGALNGTAICFQNRSVVLDSRGANFTLSLGNKVLYTGIEFEIKKPGKPAVEGGIDSAIIVVIILLAVVAVAVAVVVIIYCWRKRKRNSQLDTTEMGTLEEKKPLENGEGH